MKRKEEAILRMIPIAVLGLLFLAYISGVISQGILNYREWERAGGMTGPVQIKAIDPSLFHCLGQIVTAQGFCIFLVLLLSLAALIAYLKLRRRHDGESIDSRGFLVSRSGLYGTAGWMSQREMREVLEVTPIEKARGIILGESAGKAVSLPVDTRLNRHIAVFGASGTMKSRAVIRNALFQDIKRGESVILTDPKGELYEDTAELFRQNGYEIRVFNLIHPEHSDAWNCMADLNGDTQQAQLVTNVIINNTGSVQGDHFWDNGEGNLLKAMILYIDQDPTLAPEEKNLPAVYRMLTNNSEKQLTALFDRLPSGHPARTAFFLFSQGSDTVKSGIILGLGTRLQVLQSDAVQGITSQSGIDLTAPARKKCAYFIILSDSENSMGFLSSLFFSFLLIKLPAYADDFCSGRCPVPVNLILDEFCNIGRIGGDPTGRDFTRSLSTVRSRDIRIMIAVQSMGQLQNRYPNGLWSEITGNADVQLMLGCSDMLTAEQFSLRSGLMSIQVDSTSTTRRALALTRMTPMYRETQSHGRRQLLTTDEVLRLGNDELLCVLRGYKMLKLRKLDYTQHPMAGRIRKDSLLNYQPARPVSANPRADPDQTEHTTRPVRRAEPPEDF